MTPDTNASSTRSAASTCFVAVSALAVAMGVGRFAFTPMLPLMIRDGAILPNAGAWLAASNYLGYLAGALVASQIRLSSPSLMLVSLVGTVIATAAIGATDGLTIWLMLRFAAGAMSAWTLIATSTWALRELTGAARPRLAGLVYSGVGLGIAVVGLFCIVAARPDVSAQDLWVELGVLAAILTVAPALLLLGRSAAERPSASPQIMGSSSAGERQSCSLGIVICYGLFGFGYILPATFLPALAREVVDDPRLFGLAWPIFGIAAAVSTVIVALLFDRFNRLRVWACSHLLRAAGVVLPTIWLSLKTIAIAAFLVGGTFMVITMLGLQVARSLATDNPTTILGRMTAAFALGQLAGPLASAALGLLPIGHVAALGMALQLATIGLVMSAVALWKFSRMAHNGRSTALNSSNENSTTSSSTPQGFGASTAERLPIPARNAMSEAQRHAADAIIAGPRKAILGPFVALLQCPALMEHVGKTGETLRFQGCLPKQVRELAICVVARETSNQFEWQMHAPLAIEAGVAQTAIDSIHAGRRPRGLAAELETTVDFVTELMLRHGVGDETYAEAIHKFGEAGTVELAALVGYFAMVCWVMNVARTPGPENTRTAPLTAFPR
jgi:alkylhydroperoxidase family enzyme/predicted MFS family arabinose efflux permease